MWYNTLLKNDIVPDFMIRMKIRSLLRERLKEQKELHGDTVADRIKAFVQELSEEPVAVNTEDANEQHYEVPTEFYKYALGPNLKYSCAWYEDGAQTLEEAELQMLQITCDRAKLKNGQDVLELGCGWGSLSLFMAAKYPKSNFTVVSNSSTQKEHIDSKAAERRLTNLHVLTADMNVFDINKKFNRVVSVEMFEHMRNYKVLMKKISNWLKDDGKLFVHIFTHKEYAYKYEVKDDTDWMSKYFFTGGIMPSNDLLFYFDEDMVKEKQWLVNGVNYSKTAEAWLSNTDKYKEHILPIMVDTYGKENALLWFAYWRIFFMSCSELWKFNNGEEWMISHYLFKKR